MKFHGKLLGFLAAWFATVGVAFFLPNLEVLAADCNACQYCEELAYAGIYQGGQLFIANGYSAISPGQAGTQAFQGGGCSDPPLADFLYLAEACHSFPNCPEYDINLVLNVTTYFNPNWPCDLPKGATPMVQEFNGGQGPKKGGTTEQYACPVVVGSQPVP